MRSLIVIAIAPLAFAACNVGQPAAPTTIAAAVPPSVATAQPGVWNTREELTAWVANGRHTAAAIVVGDGADAVIRIDLPTCVYPCAAEGTEIDLQSPGFEPAVDDLRTFRMRYRWMPNGPYGGATYLTPWVNLQSPSPSLGARPPTELFLVVGDRQGAWVEEEFIPWSGSGPPPYAARGAMLGICSYCERGRLEIDWLALVRE